MWKFGKYKIILKVISLIGISTILIYQIGLSGNQKYEVFISNTFKSLAKIGWVGENNNGAGNDEISNNTDGVIISQKFDKKQKLFNKIFGNDDDVDDIYTAHRYNDSTDLRVIVMTFNRANSLNILLTSLEEMEMDGDEVSIDIWIDRKQADGTVDNKTLKTSIDFAQSSKLNCTVHVHQQHVGLYGQWLLTYYASREKIKSGREKVLFMEDDQQVSKFAYRWLKSVHQFYEKDDDYLGSTLKTLTGHKMIEKIPSSHSVFQHRIFSTHAFIPKLSVWRQFQRWLPNYLNRKSFKPYVPNIKPTQWYQSFEKKNKTSTMWSMWLIYFTYVEQLFTVYPNTKTFSAYQTKNKTNYCLNINRQEKGLHFGNKLSPSKYCTTLDFWTDALVSFPDHIYKIDWNGKRLL